MSGVPEAERNKRQWLAGWHDGVNQRTRSPHARATLGQGERNFWEEGRRAGAIALDRAHREAADLFGPDNEKPGPGELPRGYWMHESDRFYWGRPGDSHPRGNAATADEAIDAMRRDKTQRGVSTG